VDENQFRDVSDTDDDKDREREPEPQTEDGLMQLMRELQTERQESRETAQERALNEALIRGGLAMAASDEPDFLAAAAEGGIGGLAGYQSAMERAAERQGEISSDLTDLAVARETARLKGLGSAFEQQEAMREAQENRVDTLIDLRKTLQDSLETVVDEGERTRILSQIQDIDSIISPYMGLSTTTGSEGPVAGEQMTAR
jgi:hypothetical protein